MQGGVTEGKTKTRQVAHPTELIEVPLIDANGLPVFGDNGEELYEYQAKMIVETYSPFNDLLAKELAGEITIQWLTDQEKADYAAQQAQELINTESRAYLSSTDWYVIRFKEIAEPIPQKILDARQAARDAII